MAQIKTKDTERMMDLYLSNMTSAIEKISIIKDVVKTFDNKVFNARLVNKIEDVINAGLISTKHYHFSIEFNTSCLRLTMCFYNHRSFAGEDYYQYLPDGLDKIDIVPYTPSGYNNCYSSKSNEDYYKKQDDTYFYIDGDNLRINADFICKKLKEGRAHLEEKIKKLQEDRERLEEYETKRKELAEQLKELQNAMAYECKSIYHLKDYNMYI